jgi:hypothetical protein
MIAVLARDFRLSHQALPHHLHAAFQDLRRRLTEQARGHVHDGAAGRRHGKEIHDWPLRHDRAVHVLVARHISEMAPFRGEESAVPRAGVDILADMLVDSDDANPVYNYQPKAPQFNP